MDSLDENNEFEKDFSPAISRFRSLESIAHVPINPPALPTKQAASNNEMDATDLVNSIETTAKILSIQRLNRKIKIDGETKFVSSKTILIKFESQLLPPVVSLFKIRLPVYLYIPQVQLCYNYYCFGHISTNCKRKTRCLRCGGAKHDINEECSRSQQPSICCNCGSEHLPTILNCPSNIKQK
ncbi:hypothetical protein ACFW04_006895 [Cataglyphis niger]